MPNAIRILLSSQSDPELAAALGRELIDSLDRQLRKTCGGAGVGTKTALGFVGEISGVHWSIVAPLVEAFENANKERLKNAQIVISPNSLPLRREERDAGHMLSTAPKKLTKSLFLSLPTGSFLVSNIMGRDYRSVFAAEVANASERAQQWTQIAVANADQRQCRVFQSRGKYLEWQADMRRLTGG